MPKRNARPGTRTKARPARRPQSPAVAPSFESEPPIELQPAVAAPRAENNSRAMSATVAASSRRNPPGRRIPTVSTDYGYLKRDITLLGILAPVMIIVVVIAFFILH